MAARETMPEQAIQSPVQELAEETTQRQPEAQVIMFSVQTSLLFTTVTSSASSRKSEHLFAQLAGNNLGPLGPAGCEGVLDRMDQRTLSNHASHHFSEVGGSFPASGGGSPVPTSKASSGGGPSL